MLLKLTACAVALMSMVVSAEMDLTGVFPPEVKTVGVIMPASIFGKASFDRVHAALTNAGYRVKLAPRLNFTKVASAADRARDLEDMWLDPEVDLVLCARGGTGAERTIEKVDWNKLRTRPDQKLLGFSNITMILNAMLRKGVGHPISGSSMSHFTYARGDTGAWLRRTVSGADQPPAKLVALRPGAFSGLPCGGHISLVAKGLKTGWNADWTGRVVFLERNGSATKEGTRAELDVILASPELKKAVGVVFGDLSLKGGTKADSDDLKRAFADRSPVPVYDGYAYGHIAVSHAIDFRRRVTVTETGEMNWEKRR